LASTLRSSAACVLPNSRPDDKTNVGKARLQRFFEQRKNFAAANLDHEPVAIINQLIE